MIKVGDNVLALENNGSSSGLEGIVIKVREFNPKDPIVDHGVIEIKVTKLGKKNKYNKIDELEHWVHYNWEKFLKVL